MTDTPDGQDTLAAILSTTLKRTALIAILKQLVLLVAALALSAASLIAALDGAGAVAWAGFALFSGAASYAIIGLIREFGLATRRPGDDVPSPWSVTFDDERISCRYGRRKAERVAWGDLAVVGLRAEDAFPVGEVFWMMFGARGEAVVVPIGARGADALLAEFQKRLAGFDNEKVIEVMGKLDGGAVVWERAA